MSIDKISLNDLLVMEGDVFWSKISYKSFKDIKDMLRLDCLDEELENVLASHSPDWKMWNHLSDKSVMETFKLIDDNHGKDFLTRDLVEESIEDDTRYLVQQLTAHSPGNMFTAAIDSANVLKLLEMYNEQRSS